MFIFVLLASLVTVSIVLAAGYDMTAPGAIITLNGAIFEVFNPDDPSGSGLFKPFVRISSPESIIQGYNTNYRPVQFNENDSGTFTRSRLLSEVPQIEVQTTLYREFQLNINQNTGIPDRYLTLDTVELYESPYSDLCGYPFDGSGGGHSGCTSDNTATLIYDMDAAENSFFVMDYTINEGSGKRDLRMLVPDAIFNQNPNCNFSGTGCTVYITIYSHFGEDSVGGSVDPLLQVPHVNNDGYEEWGVRDISSVCLTVTKIVKNDDGGELEVIDFPLFVSGSPVTSGQQNCFIPGDYIVSETGDPDYAMTIGGDCDAEGNISLAPGDAKSCTITNDDIPSEIPTSTFYLPFLYR